ncbi:hypothetical protein Tco_1387961, partial [Tanacetum coccineum]
PEDQELEAHYLYMVKIQKVTLDAANNSGPIFDTKPLQKVKNHNDNYNVFANDREHPEQSEYVNDTYMEEQGDTNITIDSLDMNTNGETVDQDDNDLAKECEIKDFKTKNKSLEPSNNNFKEANNELSKTNQLKFKDLKKFQAELDRYHNVNYVLKMEIDCAKAKGDLMSYKMESQKSLNEHTQKINYLNQMISEMKKELVAHQETISIISQENEVQNKFYKTREDKEIEKVIALENKVKVLDDIVYKTGQSVQTMNILNHNYKMSFVKPEYLKKAQRANPRMYDIGCYNDNLALMEYYYTDNMNAILGVYTKLDEVTNLQCDYLEALKKCERLENELLKRNTTLKSFEPLQQHATNLELALQQRVIPTTSVSRPRLKSNQLEDRVMDNNSQGKKQQVIYFKEEITKHSSETIKYQVHCIRSP